MYIEIMLGQNIVYVEYMNDEIMFMLKNCDYSNNKCWIMVYVEMKYVQIFACQIDVFWNICMLNLSMLKNVCVETWFCWKICMSINV